MDNLTPPDTRRRSRSKTPFLRSSCDRESCAHLGEGHIHENKKSPVKRAPTVQTIIEEVIEHKTPVYRQTQIIKKRTSNIVSSDYSSEEHSPDSAKAASGVKASTLISKTHVGSSTSYSNSYGNVSVSTSEKQSSAIQSGLAVKTKEVSQNEINSAFEKSQMQTSTPILNQSPRSQVLKLSNGDLSDHIAYKEYKEAGEYWKKYPKTDYTYSKLSPHRRELAPGVVAMPNMSRRSLEKHHERVNYMVQRNPAQESYIRKRYESTQYQYKAQDKLNEAKELYYDSQDEIDLTELDNSKRRFRYMQVSSNKSAYNESFMTSVLTSIVTIFYRFIGIFWSTEEDLYRSRISQRQGVLGRTRSVISSAILRVFHYIYLLISSVLYLDTWLLRSSTPDNKTKKRFLLALLLLLPLLLLTGVYYYLNPPEYFPPTSFSTLSFPISVVNFSEYVDSAQLEHLKLSAFEKIDDLKAWSEDYFGYLKTVSQNVLSEAHKIWLENFNN